MIGSKAAILLFLLVSSSQLRSPLVPPNPIPEDFVTSRNSKGRGAQATAGGRGREGKASSNLLLVLWTQSTHFIRILVEINNWRHAPFCLQGKSGKPRNVQDKKAQSQREATGEGRRKGRRWPRQQIPSLHPRGHTTPVTSRKKEGISYVGQSLSSLACSLQSPQLPGPVSFPSHGCGCTHCSFS